MRDFFNLVAGIDQSGSDTLPHALYDNFRIDYFDQYLHELKRATDDGARVTGYFAWSLLDNFEWRMGFTSKFGIVYVDRKTFTRYPKDSTRWFRKVIKRDE
jgi:beta-glucosidase